MNYNKKRDILKRVKRIDGDNGKLMFIDKDGKKYLLDVSDENKDTTYPYNTDLLVWTVRDMPTFGYVKTFIKDISIEDYIRFYNPDKYSEIYNDRSESLFVHQMFAEDIKFNKFFATYDDSVITESVKEKGIKDDTNPFELNMMYDTYILKDYFKQLGL